MKNEIDHIVYCVPNMDRAIHFFEEKLGVTPVIGGKHLTQGTHNALLNLGQNSYLEILSIDHQNTKIQPPRWMGIDLIKKPLITRWCLKTPDIHKDAKIINSINTDLGQVMEGKREKPNGEIIEWKLTRTLANPIIELTPFLIDWSASTSHPTSGLPQHCNLHTIELTHPSPKPLNKILNHLDTTYTISKGSKPDFKIALEGSNGIVHL